MKPSPDPAAAEVGAWVEVVDPGSEEERDDPEEAGDEDTQLVVDENWAKRFAATAAKRRARAANVKNCDHEGRLETIRARIARLKATLDAGFAEAQSMKLSHTTSDTTD